MIPLLRLAIEAHGGLERWQHVYRIDFKLTIGGGLWQLKGLPQGLVDVALHVEPADRLVTIAPFGPKGATGYFTSDRVWSQKPRGDVVQERFAPRRSFDGHTLTTPWDKLHELYFVSYAFLNYLSTPFLFAEPGFEVAEGNPYLGAGEKWRRLHVKYPAGYPTHSREQTLYFSEGDCCSDSTMWLRWFRPAPRTSVWNTRPLTELSFPRADVLSAAMRSRKSRTVRLLPL